MNTEIQHVSDTALMVAAARALETVRSNGLINDPYAAALAGERGMAILNARGQEWMRIGISVRTHFIDDLILESLRQHGVMTVVNLGAGLDTRPWRMDLPSALRWIEVDFEPILDYKFRALANEKPKCVHQVIYADLANTQDRERIYQIVGREPALMITEGLLMYLSADALRALATEPPSHTGIGIWIFDIASIHLMRVAHSQGLKEIEKVRAQGHLTGIEITNAVHETGWRLLRHLSYAKETARLVASGRLDPMPKISSEAARPPEDDPSGVYLFAHQK